MNADHTWKGTRIELDSIEPLTAAPPLSERDRVALVNAGARRAFCTYCERGHEGKCTGPVALPKPGDLVEHIHRDLDPRRVVSVGAGWLTLDICGSESSRLPITNYRAVSR